MPLLFLLFVVMPIVEMSILIAVGTRIGAAYTIGLVLLTALVGSVMLRQQGLETLLRARTKIESGEIPAREFIEGLLLAIGGALLITPGFVTDSIGFLCLLPHSRRFAIEQLRRRAFFSASASMQQHTDRTSSFSVQREKATTARRGERTDRKSPETLEGEFSRDDDE